MNDGLNFVGPRDGTARQPGRPEDSPVRVGLFGKLGSGNIGNDASMEAVLQFLQADHPDAIVDAMCGGAALVADRYGIPATPLNWFQRYESHIPGPVRIPLKILGKGIDVGRTAAWVRRHDAVIVPGMGVLEASLPLRATEFPYAMFWLGVWGKLLGTKVALVSVGAGTINQRLTRWLFDWAARLAGYRSFRNSESRDAMVLRGVKAEDDPVYPDLAFALPAPPVEPGDPHLVCVGVMAYHGSNDERKKAEQIYSRYATATKEFVRWLVDNNYRVRLVVGDTNGSDDAVVQEILADLEEHRPELPPGAIVAVPVVTLADVTRAMHQAGSVVAIRFHNVLAGLKLCKPIITIGYSAKHRALMADMGVPEFCLEVNTLDSDQLIARFADLQSRSTQLRQILAEHNGRNAHLLRQQFADLSAKLFPAPRPAQTVSGESDRPDPLEPASARSHQ
jgi:polysaccharide pyruvyl transferase WcaK-like protein